jgi:hypothetical protein
LLELPEKTILASLRKTVTGTMIRKEFGSDFSYLSSIIKEEKTDDITSFYPEPTMFFSGRAALYSILKKGIEDAGWSKIFVPEYYCHDVTDFVGTLGIIIEFYSFGPYSKNLTTIHEIDKKGNVVLVVNNFGLAPLPFFNLYYATTIEDHTHDLVSDKALQSKADYCFASLRKTVPVPCGGIAWSPKGNEILAPLETSISQLASYMKLSAMLLKTQYLGGAEIRKDYFRDLYNQSEELFSDSESYAKMPSFVLDLLQRISLHQLNKSKVENFQEICDQIKNKSIIFKFDVKPGVHPLGLVLKFKSREDKVCMQNHLVSFNIFPAVLWPKQKESVAKNFSDTMLFVHCDIRYTLEDMKYIAEIINMKADAN